MLKPLKIKDINIQTPVFLAPMAGITDFPYRHVVDSFKSNFMYSEMISANAITRNSVKSFRMSDLSKDNKSKVAIQLAGSDIETMIDATKKAQDMGAVLIDINMGCPAKKVTNGIAGSALMKDEILASKVINAVVKNSLVPVTVKMRMGWDSENKNAPQLAKIAQEEGASLVTVHGRTRRQFYEGSADWEFIAKVKANVNIPVIANGDIIDEETAVLALEQSNADGLMIGRGSYGKPWLIQQISHYLTYKTKLPEPSLEDKLDIALKHYDLMIEYYGENIGIKNARKHLSWYTKGLKNSASLRAKINVSNTVKEVKDLVTQCFEQSGI